MCREQGMAWHCCCICSHRNSLLAPKNQCQNSPLAHPSYCQAHSSSITLGWHFPSMVQHHPQLTVLLTRAGLGLKGPEPEWQGELLSPAQGKASPAAAEMQQAQGSSFIPSGPARTEKKMKVKDAAQPPHGGKKKRERKKKSHCSCSKTLPTKRIIYCNDLVLSLNTNH